MSEIKEKEKQKEEVTPKTIKSDVRKAFGDTVVLNNEEEVENKSPTTYLCLQDTEQQTLFEMDLVFIRQKGENEKFLEITLPVVKRQLIDALCGE